MLKKDKIEEIMRTEEKGDLSNTRHDCHSY